MSQDLTAAFSTDAVRHAFSSMIAAGPRPAGERPPVIDIPLVTGTGRVVEQFVVTTMVERGVDRARILYVCERAIEKDMAQTLGVATANPFTLPRRDLASYDVVMVGDMFPRNRTIVFKQLAGFGGQIINSVPHHDLPPNFVLGGAPTAEAAPAVLPSSGDTADTLEPVSGGPAPR